METTYRDLLKFVLENGTESEDRTGVGTYSVFGHQCRYNLADGFPLLTGKRMFWRGIVVELLWFLSGSTNIQPLLDQNVHIWDEWADTSGDIGAGAYGAMWRAWPGAEGQVVDQIKNVIEQIKTNPTSRRLIVSAWNPALVDQTALPPCHSFFQFSVKNNRLSCHLYQRSGDAFLGVPFNIASYSLLTHIIAKLCGLQVGEFVHSFGDLHIYKNHLAQVCEYLSRDLHPLPHVEIGEIANIDSVTLADIVLKNYICNGPIHAPVAV